MIIVPVGVICQEAYNLVEPLLEQRYPEHAEQHDGNCKTRLQRSPSMVNLT